ncbi:hypothetical protein LEMLEM_LOCUS9401, partial [Lemmus lemmus]
LWRSGECVGSPGTGTANSCEPRCRSAGDQTQVYSKSTTRDPHSGSCARTPSTSPTEPSLQALCWFLCQLEPCGKREPLLRNCLPQIGLEMIDVRGPRPLWTVPPWGRWSWVV